MNPFMMRPAFGESEDDYQPGDLQRRIAQHRANDRPPYYLWHQTGGPGEGYLAPVQWSPGQPSQTPPRSPLSGITEMNWGVDPFVGFDRSVGAEYLQGFMNWLMQQSLGGR